jgi:hypothetical protein
VLLHLPPEALRMLVASDAESGEAADGRA